MNKKNLLVLFSLLFTVFSKLNAQSCAISFPDPNFKSALLNHNAGPIDTNFDGEICIEEAMVVQNLILPNTNIYNTSGIEHFRNVKTLILANNNFAVLNLEANTNLITLIATSSNIHVINLPHSSKLKTLLLDNNNLTSIDLSHSPGITSIGLANNNLRTINLQNSPDLASLNASGNLLKTFDISNSPNLSTLYLSDNRLESLNITPNNEELRNLYLSNNLFTSLDIRNALNIRTLRLNGNTNLRYLPLAGSHEITSNSTNFTNNVSLEDCPNLNSVCLDNANSTVFTFIKDRIQNHYGYQECNVTSSCSPSTTCDIITFSDIHFKASLFYENGGNVPNFIDANRDGEICIEEAEAVTELIVAGASLTLSDLQYFPNITSFKGGGGGLMSSIDFSHNSELDYLLLTSYPNLESVNISNNTKLKELLIGKTNLNTVNLSNSPNLEYLLLRENNISTLNLNQNTELKELDISIDKLSAINLNQNTELKELDLRENNLSTINLSQNTKLERLNLTNNNISQIDLSNNPELEVLSLSYNPINEIDLTENINLTSIALVSTLISSLDMRNSEKSYALFIRDCPNLETMYLENLSTESNDWLGSFSNCPNLDFICLGNDVTDAFLQEMNRYIRHAQQNLQATLVKDCPANRTSAKQTAIKTHLADTTKDDFSNSLRVSPNPVTNTALLQVLPKDAVVSHISIFSTSGIVQKRIVSFDNISSDNGYALDLSDISSGLYFIQVDTNKGTFSSRLIKN